MYFGLDSPNKKIFFYVFTMSNLILGGVYLYNGILGGDLSLTIVEQPLILSLAIFLVVFSFYFVGFIHSSFLRISIPNIKNFKVRHDAQIIDLIVFVFLLFSFLFSILYGYGRVGFDSELSPSFVIYFNKFFVPILFAEIYLFFKFLSNSRLYYINLALFLILAVYKGYTGPILHIGFLLIYRLYIKNKLNVKIISIMLLLAVLFGPIIRIIKNIIIRDLVTGGEGDYSNGLDTLYTISNASSFLELYFVYLQRVIERFESISAVYYIIINSNMIQNLYESYAFLPFYLYHWVPQTIEKIFSQNSVYDVTQVYAQREIAHLISPYFDWQIHIGYFGWIFISPLLSVLYILYTFVLIFVCTQLTKLLSSERSAIEQLSWYFAMSYIVHGWFNEYLLYVQALIVFILILVVVNFLIKPLKRVDI